MVYVFYSMAAEQMRRVTTLLTCAVCHEMYKNPKYLPCHHTYCEECIAQLLIASEVICPECRETSTILHERVANLPNNFFMNHLMDAITLQCRVDGEEKATCDMCVEEGSAIALCPECVMFLCDYCNEFHKRAKEYLSHNVILLHELQSMNLRLNAKTTTEHRKKLQKVMEPVEKMIDDLSALHQKVAATGEKIGAQTTEIDQQIDLYYEELYQQLQRQKEELKSKLQEMSRQKKKVISLQLRQLEYTQAQLESLKELNDACAVSNGSDEEALFARKQLYSDIKKVTECYKKFNTNPVELASMVFVPIKEYKDSFPQFSKLFDEHTVAANCEVTDVPLQVVIGNMIDFKVITKSIKNTHCSKGGSNVIAQVQSSTGDVAPVEVKDNNDGSYSASFVTKHVGEVKLSVTIEGQHIKGSPYSIMVHRDYRSVDEPIKVVNDIDGEKMGNAHAIACNKDGLWALTCDGHHCVYMFDSHDESVWTFGNRGHGKVHFNYPYGLAFDNNNYLYVSDYGNSRVQKFSITGFYICEFGKLQLNGPRGVVIHSSKVFVADTRNGQVSVFQLNGQFCYNIGSRHLRSPYDVSVTTNNQLLVADMSNNSIFSFTLDGTYIGKFGNSQLIKPHGLVTDMYGFVHVTEINDHYVAVFDQNGTFVCSFGCSGSAHGQLSDPRGIAVSPNGNIYVADYGNKRVQIF